MYSSVSLCTVENLLCLWLLHLRTDIASFYIKKKHQEKKQNVFMLFLNATFYSFPITGFKKTSPLLFFKFPSETSLLCI